MLRTKLFKGFALVILLFAALSAMFGLRTIKKRIIDEAQNKVISDLRGAWSVFDNQLERIATIIELAAWQRVVQEHCHREDWGSADLHNRLETIRRNSGFDFMGLVSYDGTTVFRATPPFNRGDGRLHDPLIARALKGAPASGIELWSHAELRAESDGLAERAFFEINDTPHARISPKSSEDRGMVMLAAAPVLRNGEIIAAIYAGKLLNRNHELVDRIQSVIYGDELYKDSPVGTATLFLHDTRIATTVTRQPGIRALGTRVSREVAELVLDNGKSWISEAFVVNNWYLTAYDPIRDIEGRIIGMLYVGILRQPFIEYGRNLMLQHLTLCLFALLAALFIAFWLANRLSRPIHRLVQAATHMSQGKGRIEVSSDSACEETSTLIAAFNEMSARLDERENNLKSINRSYMETLGFVSHELKSPIASVVNYLYLLRRRKLGELVEKQEKALFICEQNIQQVVEMIRRYLNLSRIENRELSPAFTRVAIKEEVITPLLDSMELSFNAEHIAVHNEINTDVIVSADINMTREIFDNLISNAVKYGRKGGTIALTARSCEDFFEFTVRNEGEAIPPEKMKCVFQKFFRVEQIDRKQRGSGLGLFITRNIVEAHGGKINMESDEKTGTAVVFTLPKWREESPQKEPSETT